MMSDIVTGTLCVFGLLLFYWDVRESRDRRKRELEDAQRNLVRQSQAWPADPRGRYIGQCIQCGEEGYGPDRMGKFIVCLPCIDGPAVGPEDDDGPDIDGGLLDEEER